MVAYFLNKGQFLKGNGETTCSQLCYKGTSFFDERSGITITKVKRFLSKLASEELLKILVKVVVAGLSMFLLA